MGSVQGQVASADAQLFERDALLLPAALLLLLLLLLCRCWLVCGARIYTGGLYSSDTTTETYVHPTLGYLTTLATTPPNPYPTPTNASLI